MRRAVVAILGVAVLALLVARYARELIDLALRLPLILLDLVAGLLAGLQSLLQQLATDAGPVLAPLGDGIADVAAHPGERLGSLLASLGDVVGRVVGGVRDIVADWWGWAAAHPETVIVVLFWAFVGIIAVAVVRRRTGTRRPRRRGR